MTKQIIRRPTVPTTETPSPDGTLEVPVDHLAPNPFQPRKQWSEAELAELVESVKAHGILQPLVARRRGGALELVAGERRLTAARQAGLTRVPVVLRDATDREMLELALVENLQRESISAADEAEAYRRLMDEFHLTQVQVSERVGKSRSAIANAVRLLTLPPAVFESLRKGDIDAGHGRALLGISDGKLLLRTWQQVVRRKLSVRQTEALAAKLSRPNVSRETSRPGATGTALDPNLLDVQEQLTRRLSAKVRLRPAKGKGGAIEIEYADAEDLDRLYWQLLGQ